MAEQQSLPVDPLPQTPNLPGAVSDTRDGITVDSNTGTQAELTAGLDALDAAIEKEAPETPREAKTGRFTSKERRSNPVARMEEATAKEAAAKRERDEAVAERDRLKTELEAARKPAPAPVQAAPQPAYEPPKPPEDPEPNAGDVAKYPGGEFDPQYLRDIGKWEARQEFRRQSATQQQQQQVEQRVRGVEAGLTAYSNRMKAAFPEPEGLKTYVAALPKELADLKPSSVQAMLQPNAPLTAGNVIADEIITSESPKQLTDYLKDHPQDLQRLLTLHPIAVVREMGRLNERIAAAAAKETRTAPAREPVSRARPPVQRVESVPQISDAPPGDDASDDEHMAYYNRKERAHRYGR